MPKTRKCPLAVVLLVGLAAAGGSQAKTDYNDLYKYVFSLGAQYGSLSPFASYRDTEISSYYDIAGSVRVPLPFLPVLQPFLKAGMMRLNTPDRADQAKWGHTHWYATPGIAYAHRFSKSFEAGVELAAGMSEALFEKLDPDGTRGSPNFLASAGARVSLDPSYSMSIDFVPSLLYFHSLTPLDRFNGFALSIGFSASYRYGEDPDSPRAIIRSVALDEIAFPSVFAAMQGFYAKNPITRTTIRNVEKFDITNVEVSFFQAGYMDNPTTLASIPMLKPGKSQDIDVRALYSDKVFDTQGVTPLTGEIVVEYVSRGRPARQSMPVSYELQDKNAVVWNDDRKVGAFITPRDGMLASYTSFIAQSAKDRLVPGLSEHLQTAMQIYSALKGVGCRYQADPSSPFTSVQGDTLAVDSISLPRQTLTVKNRTGDCDDLTVLYCSLLETMGIPTAYITVPGHIFPAFNTRLPSSLWREVHPDRTMTLSVNGELWIPVEVTLLESSDFLGAWRKGIEQYKSLDSDPSKRTLTFTAEAQRIYTSVALKELDRETLQSFAFGSQQAIAAGFADGADRLVSAVIDSYAASAKDTGTKADQNRLGIVCAKYGRYDQAEKAFATALSIDRNYTGALMNLGNVHFLKQRYTEALKTYGEVEAALASGGTGSPSWPLVLLNISRCYYELENYPRAKEYLDRVSAVAPSLAEPFAFIRTAEGSGKAAAAAPRATVLFAEAEE